MDGREESGSWMQTSGEAPSRTEPTVAELAAQLSELRQRHDELMTAFRDETIGRRRNIHYQLEELSLRDTADFVGATMVGAQAFADPVQTLRYALSLAPVGGLALEFGVFQGRTLGIIANERGDGRVHGFDSFEGLPEEWRPGFPAGTFRTAKVPKVPGAHIVTGWFDDSLPRFLKANPEPVDFVHIDCDIYSSTRTVLELLEPRLKPGTVVLFDEYFNYPGWRQHEHRAWTEFAERTAVKFQYECYTFNNEQMALRIVE